MAEDIKTATRTMPGGVRFVIKLVCTATVILYMYTAIAGMLQPMMQRSILLGVAMVLVFLLWKPYAGAPRWFLAVDIVFIVMTIAFIGLAIYSGEQMIKKQYFTLQPWQFPIAMIFTLLTLEASRRAMGPVMSIIVIFFLVYGFTSGHWPGFFHTFTFAPIMVMEFVALSTEGIFGIVAHIVSTMIIMFMIFASFLKFSGAGKFFFDFPLALLGRVRGGPAKVSVVGSGLFGMFSGSAVANVVATGTFTIPMMKNVGYRAADAGAIEACASTGGQLMPPVMGAAAFIIAENLGVRYWEVVVAAFVPGVLYYVALFSIVDIKAAKLGLRGVAKSELPSAWVTTKKYGYLMTPLLILIYLLGKVQASAQYSCFWAILAIFALSFVRRESWMTPKKILDASEDTMKDSLGVILVCGIIVGIFGITGLGHKLSMLLFDVAKGNMFILLVLAAIVCYVLGMGVTTTAIYVLVATLVAPALTKIGIVPMAAHLGVFYFAMISCITPPVATAVYAGAALAKEDFWKVGWQSVKLGTILFVLPFIFIFEPALILKGSVSTILITLVSTFIGIALFSFLIEGHSYWGRTGVVSRIIFAAACVLLVVPGLATDIIGCGVLAVGGLVHWQEVKRQRLAAAEVQQTSSGSKGSP